MTNLYFIKDVVSGVAESTIIQCMNDGVALRGFIEFCKKDNVIDKEHALYCIGSCDESNHIVDCNYRLICDGSKAQSVYDSFVASLED